MASAVNTSPATNTNNEFAKPFHQQILKSYSNITLPKKNLTTIQINPFKFSPTPPSNMMDHQQLHNRFRTNNHQPPQSSKKFISLSEILNNEKASALSSTSSTLSSSTTSSPPLQFNNHNTTIDETVANTNRLLRFKKYPTSHSLTPSIANATLQTPLIESDFLTVQELFEELQLDCDDQIKQLDTFERKRKEEALKQKKILDDIKLKCQMYPQLFKLKSFNNNNNNKSFSTTTNATNTLSTKNVTTSCKCFRYGRRETWSAWRRITKEKKSFVSNEKFRFRNSLLRQQKRQRFMCKFIFIVQKLTFLVTKLGKYLILEKRLLHLKETTSLTIVHLDVELVLWRNCVQKCSSIQQKVNKNVTTKQNSLLDKFYNMYCGTTNDLENIGNLAKQSIEKNRMQTLNENSASKSAGTTSSLLVRRNRNLDEVCIKNDETNEAENRKVT